MVMVCALLKHCFQYLELSTSSARAPNRNSWVVLETHHNYQYKVFNREESKRILL